MKNEIHCRQKNSKTQYKTHDGALGYISHFHAHTHFSRHHGASNETSSS